jgi:hypothetical protein
LEEFGEVECAVFVSDDEGAAAEFDLAEVSRAEEESEEAGGDACVGAEDFETCGVFDAESADFLWAAPGELDALGGGGAVEGACTEGADHAGCDGGGDGGEEEDEECGEEEEGEAEEEEESLPERGAALGGGLGP